MAPRGAFLVELKGFDDAQRLLLRLSDFQRLARIPLAAGLGAAKDVFTEEVGSRKAKAAMKVRIFKNDQTGLTGVVGPVGGAHRPGLPRSALPREGHRRLRAQASSHPAQERQGDGVLVAAGGVLELRTLGPALHEEWSGSQGRFSRFGNAGQVVVRSTRGAPARPWYQRAIARSRPLVSQRFAEKLHEQVIAGG
jgi:hypothetical protein